MKTMQLEVLSRQEIESLLGRPDWAVISITDPVSAFGPARLQSGWLAVLRMEFFDADPAFDMPDIAMTREEARQIVEFVRQYAPQVKGFVIHCNQGISRSQAVAAWIADAHNLEFTPDQRFNHHVFHLLKTEDD